jgi:hypothetical protein
MQGLEDGSKCGRNRNDQAPARHQMATISDRRLRSALRQLWSRIRNASLGWGYSPQTPHGGRLDIDFDPRNESVSVEKIGLHGRWLRSSNQRWVLAYGQIFDPNADSWSSDDPTGAVILFDNGKQVCRLDGLCRPETVALCDAGVFAVYEWGPSSEFLGPRCRLRVFTADGKCIFEHRPGAAVERPALSADGRYLAFHTLAAPRESPRPQDGESVFLVDLHGPTFLWQRPVPVVWPERITFDEASRRVLVHTGPDEVFRYTYAGELLDADAVERVELRRALNEEYGYRLFDLARVRLDQALSGKRPAGQLQEVEDLIHKALGKQMSPNTKAAAHRLLGEIAERRGDLTGAHTEYLAALALNPKIGLKKKLKSMEGTGPKPGR